MYFQISQMRNLFYIIQQIKEEIKLVKERKIELRRFIREEQAQVRKEQAEKQRLFYEKIKLEKKIEQFRKREAAEIKTLEKFVFTNPGAMLLTLILCFVNSILIPSLIASTALFEAQ